MTRLLEVDNLVTQFYIEEGVVNGISYTFGSVAVKNTADCNGELTLLLKISWEQTQKDGKQRLVARHTGLRREDLKLVRTVLLGPVDEVLQKI